MSEMLATIDGATFIERTAVNSPKAVRATKKAIREAFTVQQKGQGFSMVEVLSTCPTNWGMSPLESLSWLEEHMVPYFPLGNFRRPAEDAASVTNAGEVRA
jgi:2-oxoglutarate ferredoxin oxidoreductase subunit beta